MSIFKGHLRKMSHQINPDNEVEYSLRLYESEYASKLNDDKKPDSEKFKILEPLNQYIDKKIKIEFQDQINCIECGRKTNKSFSQGYCFPCMQSLAECDTCIIKPELCHYDQGTCRDNAFGEEHCNIPHSLYISLTSSMKIGVTRQYQEKTRWVDQGAIAALRLVTVKRRYHAGLLELELAKDMADKTNWRRMLKNDVDDKNLQEEKKILLERVKNIIQSAALDEDLSYVLDEEEVLGDKQSKVQEIKYPVLEYPEKVKSFNLDKDPIAEGVLRGIKGQYLLMDTGVINLRKYAGYLVNISI